MPDSSILVKQFDGSNYSQYFPQNVPPDIISQFVNVSETNSNNVFNYLGKYCQYWWKKYFEGQVTEYSESRTHIPESKAAYVFETKTYNQVPSSFIIKHSKEVVINSSGVSLKNPQTTTITFTQSNDFQWENECVSLMQDFLNKNKPCYCIFSDSTVYYLPNNSTVNTYNPQTIEVMAGGDSDEGWYYYIMLQYTKFTSGYTPNPAEVVTFTTKTYLKTETQYVNSTNQSAYPDGEKVDNWLYTYLGIPFENSVEKLQIACGTYTGTGSYGANSANSLTFISTPKLVLIQQNNIFYSDGSGGLLWTGWETGSNLVCKAQPNNFVWYSTKSASLQHNSSGQTYYYLILG